MRLTTLGRRNGILTVSVITVIGLILSQLTMFVGDNLVVALIGVCGSVFFLAPGISLPPAVLQTIVPCWMRAQISDSVFKDPMRLHHAVATSVVLLCGISIPMILAARRNLAQ